VIADSGVHLNGKSLDTPQLSRQSPFFGMIGDPPGKVLVFVRHYTD
jgi:hypothetical protein